MSFLFRRAPSEYSNLSIAEYRDQFADARAAYQLIDVRTPSEFKGGHLPGAKNIPLDQLAVRLGELATDKPIVVVCASGNRSRSAAQVIARAGYKPVYNLQGGTMMWTMGGNPVER